jgi:hypothetical protein
MFSTLNKQDVWVNGPDLTTALTLPIACGKEEALRGAIRHDQYPSLYHREWYPTTSSSSY